MSIYDSYAANVDLGNATDAKIKYQAEQYDMSGLNTYNPNAQNTYFDPNDEGLKQAKLEYAKNKNGGVNFKPPSNMQMFVDMLGGLLIGYGMSRLLGGDGRESLAVGLNAAAINHDNDKTENERFGIIKEAIQKNGQIYNPEDLWDYMKTGNKGGMTNSENHVFQSEQNDKRYEEQNTSREDSQNFQAGQQKERESEQEKLQNQRLTVQQQLAQARMKAANGGDLDPSGRFTITGNYTKDHEANVPLQDFMSNNRKANADLHKAQQADARIDAVDTNTPIGQVAASYQFLTVEAPSISNTVATASGVSDEAVNSWSDKINQILQKGEQRGSFTPQEISEMKDAAHKETAAMKKLAVDAAVSLAKGYNMDDLKTATAVSAATGVPANEIIAAMNNEPASQPVAKAPAGSSEGEHLSKNGRDYVVHNGLVYPA